MDTATVGREGDGPRFGDVEHGPDGEIWSVAARLQVPGLPASLRGDRGGPSGMIGGMAEINVMQGDITKLSVDAIVTAANRCADKKTSRKGREIDKWYSGKAHRPAGNVQGLAAPCGMPLWVSAALPGSTHDLTAARELVLPQARPYLNLLPFLADSGFEGAGAGVLVPVRNPARGDLDVDTKTRNALLRSLRYQGERGFALMKQRWRAMQYVTVSPTTIGDIAKAVLVLVQFEHKMII